MSLKEFTMHYQLKKHNVNSEDHTFILSLVLGYKALTDDKLDIRLMIYNSKDRMLFFKGNRARYIFSRNLLINIVSFALKITPTSLHRKYIFNCFTLEFSFLTSTSLSTHGSVYTGAVVLQEGGASRACW